MQWEWMSHLTEFYYYRVACDYIEWDKEFWEVAENFQPTAWIVLFHAIENKIS